MAASPPPFDSASDEDRVMSRQNKVNPGRYQMAGRLTPDDLGRERQRQAAPAAATRAGKARRPAWKTSSPAPPPKVAAAPGRVKVAAARTALGVTRATVGAVKTVTRVARKAIGAPTSRASTSKTGAAARRKPARSAAASSGAARGSEPAKRR
jgi:hypothetical protein